MDAKVTRGSPSTRSASVASDRHSIQSVDRALRLLETIAEMGGEATLTELANRTGLNISTCHHLLATLIKRNFAAKVPGRRLYALGNRLITLSHACLQVDLPRRAQPYMETINRATGETVHLVGWQGDSMSVLSVREARHAVRVETGKLGRLLAPHAQVSGQGDPRLAAGRRDPSPALARPQAPHRQYHHRAARADRSRCVTSAATATRSTRKNICRASFASARRSATMPAR